MRILPIALLTVALLSGCLPSEPPAHTAAPQPTSSPVFASEEEALAAAVEAYAAYLEMSDLIASEGGANPERIAPFVTPEQLQVENDGFALYEENGWSTTGRTTFDSVALQAYSGNSGAVEISVYLCSDTSALRFVDRLGADVTPTSVPKRQTLEIYLSSGSTGSTELVISSAGIWDSSGC